MSGVGPTLGGFIEFVASVMAVPNPPFDPTTSGYVSYAYNCAVQTVNSDLDCVPGLPGAWSLYSLAVYNLAADILIQTAQDQTGDPVVAESASANQPGLPYWQYLRKKWNVLGFVPGPVQSTSDQGTATAMLLPHQYALFTIADIQNLKTPYGRQYLGYAGSWGTLWGMS